jgi:conjugative relaxase-like TrwC/TraI family protein
MMRPNLITSSESAVKYYAAYALAQGEAEGRWAGKGSSRLSLDGKAVTEADLRSLLSGNNPEGQPLVKKGWDKDKKAHRHTPGWDLTFSAPKDVSIIWSSADEALRAKIEAAQERAVQDALDQLQNHSARSRTGAGGKESIASEIVAGLFQHSSNREKEPQLHTHAIVTNVAYGEDGIWRTLDSRHIYKDQRAISAVYKASLAHSIRLLGFKVERTADSFSITGVPEKVKALQSTRSRAVDDELASQGLTRQAASRELKESIVLKTRKSKTSHHHAEAARDFQRWALENAEAGFTRDSIGGIQSAQTMPSKEATPQRTLQQVSLDAMQKVTESRSVFEKVHLHSEIAEAFIGKGSYEDIKGSIHQAHTSLEMKTLLSDPSGRDKYSTRSMMAIEKRVHDVIRARADEGFHMIPQKNVDKIVKKHFPTIAPEQRVALDAATGSRSGVTLIQGVAGAGKSFTMAAVRQVFEENSYRVQGLSPTNKAARELSRSTGNMPANSIESFLFRLQAGTVHLTRKDILIIDEAGMAGSKRFDRLMQQAQAAGAKIILLGDAKQIQPIEAGQMFGEMHRRFGRSELKQVIRQTDREEAEAYLRLRNGTKPKDFEETLSYLSGKGRHYMGADSESTIRKVVEDALTYQTANPGKDSLIIASRNESVDRINRMVREEHKESGRLKDSKEYALKDGRLLDLAVGDQIIFTANLKPAGIYNSDLATVSRINGTRITALRSDQKEVHFDLNNFQGVSHGYAITSHKSQASTVDRSFVYADGPFMDKEKVYVSLTRGREGNRLYSDRASLGQISYEQRRELRKLSPKDREKILDQEYTNRLLARLSRSSEKDTTLRYRTDLERQNFENEKGMFASLIDRLGQGIDRIRHSKTHDQGVDRESAAEHSKSRTSGNSAAIEAGSAELEIEV